MLKDEGYESYTVNPARAGMIRRSSYQSCSKSSKPRASGDDPENEALTIVNRE